MTTRKSARKKTNRFEELGDHISDTKDPEHLEEPSSITDISATKIPDQDTDLKDAFLAFQTSTTAKFDKIETSYFDINDSLNSLHHSFAVLLSRQNSTNRTSSLNHDPYAHSTYDKPPHNDDAHEDDPPFPSSNDKDMPHEPADEEDDYATDPPQDQHIASRGSLTPTCRLSVAPSTNQHKQLN